MSDLIRKSNILGGPKTIVGDPNSELVLESLGKIYVKTGKNTKLLNDLFKLLNNFNTSKNNEAKVLITSSIEDIKYPGEGFLIFDSNKKVIYMSYHGEYLLLLDQLDFYERNLDYVRKLGDTMTGPLEIKTDQAPLIIISKDLVRNLNAEFLNGKRYDEYACKILEESILENWTFEKSVKIVKNLTVDKNTQLNGNLFVKKDIITAGSIGSPLFMSGYNGYGWRFDATNNMLTVDYLVVRKAMQVFELVINKISATNGSLWITDSCKVLEVSPIYIVLDFLEIQEDNWYCKKEKINILNNTVKCINYENNNIDIPIFSNESNIYNNIQFITKTSTFKDISEIIKENIFYKYFSKPINLNSLILSNYYVVTMDDKETPTFSEGDLVRCQKFQDNNIKYYDALIGNKIDSNSYIIILANSIFDKKTEISYDEKGNIKKSESINLNQYSKTNLSGDNEGATLDSNKKILEEALKNTTSDENNYSKLDIENLLLGSIQPGDNLVRIGNLYDKSKQNSVYITSSEDLSPYIQTLSGVNRPDYSVLYYQPKFLTKYIFKNNLYKYFYYKEIIKEIYDKLSENYRYSETTDNLIKYYQLYEYPNIECKIEKDDKNQYISELKSNIRVRLGNLEGIYNKKLLDKQPQGYGLYAENCYLTGEFILNNGKSVVEFTKEEINLGIGDVNKNVENLLNAFNALEYKNDNLLKYSEILFKLDPDDSNSKIKLNKYNINLICDSAVSGLPLVHKIYFGENIFKPNSIYTILFKCKLNLKSSIIINTNCAISDLNFSEEEINNVDEHSFNITINTKKDFLNLDKNFYIEIKSNNKNYNLNIYDIKIENGSKATPFSENISEEASNNALLKLDGAGLSILNKDTIVLYGNQILILTEDESTGLSNTTALFEDGKILALFIDVNKLFVQKGFCVGGNSINDAVFSVTEKGVVTITQGSINLNNGAFKVTNEGVLTATSGTLGSWTLTDHSLEFTKSGDFYFGPKIYKLATNSFGIEATKDFPTKDDFKNYKNYIYFDFYHQYCGDLCSTEGVLKLVMLGSFIDNSKLDTYSNYDVLEYFNYKYMKAKYNEEMYKIPRLITIDLDSLINDSVENYDSLATGIYINSNKNALIVEKGSVILGNSSIFKSTFDATSVNFGDIISMQKTFSTGQASLSLKKPDLYNELSLSLDKNMQIELKKFTTQVLFISEANTYWDNKSFIVHLGSPGASVIFLDSLKNTGCIITSFDETKLKIKNNIEDPYITLHKYDTYLFYFTSEGIPVKLQLR